MITVIKPLLLLHGLLVCGQASYSEPGGGVPGMPGRMPGGSGMPGMVGVPGGGRPDGRESVKIGASTATLETLMRTIAEGQGRPVFEAFKAIPEVANTTEKREQAFEGLSIYLGQA